MEIYIKNYDTYMSILNNEKKFEGRLFIERFYEIKKNTKIKFINKSNNCFCNKTVKYCEVYNNIHDFAIKTNNIYYKNIFNKYYSTEKQAKYKVLIIYLY
jgi:hypothetical protein